MNFLSYLKGALAVLRKNPKLFLPNFFMSFFYGVLLLASVSLYQKAAFLKSWGAGFAMAAPGEVAYLLNVSLALIALTALAIVLNILIGGMYPSMAKDYFAKRKISFRRAFNASKKRFLLLAASIVISFFIPSILLYFLFSMLLEQLNTAAFIPLFLAVMAVCFAAYFLFYLLISSAILGKKSLRAVFHETFSLTRKKPLVVLKATPFQFLVSMLDFFIAFLSSNPAFFALFWALKVVIPVISTYSMILNPTVYLGLKGELK